MTNQVNQDAFENWYQSNMVDPTIGIIDTDPRSVSESSWQAATQARESEINSLKQRVDELQADNERLRELCAKIYADLQMGKACRDTMENLRAAISSTPTQSLAEHDNEVIEKIKTVIANNVIPDMKGNWMRLKPLYELLESLKGK